jgi:hypothetical protein
MFKSMENNMPEQWITMKDAAKAVGTSPSKISRLASIGAIEVRENVIDRRLKLVNLEQVTELFRSQGYPVK